jgi:8-oxo-dGTP pyrophosphatase MutT (NUDIX family)
VCRWLTNVTEILRLGSCVVRVAPNRVTTTLLPGLHVDGEPHDTAAYRETAERLGYGDDVARLNRCHEVGHTLVAALLGLDASPVFERVARGIYEPTPVTEAEEAAVTALERYACLLGIDLVDVARRFAGVGAEVL